MTTNTEALRAQFEREIGEAAPFPVKRDGDSYTNPMCAWAWEAYQAGHAAAKAETAAAVAAERERAATVVDEKISAVFKANPGRGGRVNSAVAFAMGALRDCADAIRAGAKERDE